VPPPKHHRTPARRIPDSRSQRFLQRKDDGRRTHQAGFNGLRVQLDSPKAVSTALQYRQDAQESICINLQSYYGRCCNMRVFHNARPPNGQRREVGFGYSCESAWLLTETTIAWQGRTEARLRVRVKDVYRVEEQSHREPSSASVSNQHNLSLASLGSSAKNEVIAGYPRAATAIATTQHNATARR
jgi:hypothetical protein